MCWVPAHPSTADRVWVLFGNGSLNMLQVHTILFAFQEITLKQRGRGNIIQWWGSATSAELHKRCTCSLPLRVRGDSELQMCKQEIRLSFEGLSAVQRLQVQFVSLHKLINLLCTDLQSHDHVADWSGCLPEVRLSNSSPPQTTELLKVQVFAQTAQNNIR